MHLEAQKSSGTEGTEGSEGVASFFCAVLPDAT